MGIKAALKNLIIAYGGTPTAKSIKDLLGELVVLQDGQGKGRTVADHINELALLEDPLFGLTIDIDIASDTDLLGKVVDDLQENVHIKDGVVYGRSKYVDDYTGFSGTEEEQSGNYVAFHASVPDVEGVTITFTGKQTVTLDEDGILILLVGTNKRKVSFTAAKEGYGTVTKVLNLKGLTLEKAQ